MMQLPAAVVDAMHPLIDGVMLTKQGKGRIWLLELEAEGSGGHREAVPKLPEGFRWILHFVLAISLNIIGCSSGLGPEHGT